MRVLVCGARDISFSSEAHVLTRLGQLGTHTVLVVGDGRGVDAKAREIAEERGWPIELYVADWEKYGKGAGPIRNQRMVDSKPDLVIAFPSGRSVGTWDCVQRAKEAGIKIEIISVVELR